MCWSLELDTATHQVGLSGMFFHVSTCSFITLLRLWWCQMQQHFLWCNMTNCIIDCTHLEWPIFNQLFCLHLWTIWHSPRPWLYSWWQHGIMHPWCQEWTVCESRVYPNHRIHWPKTLFKASLLSCNSCVSHTWIFKKKVNDLVLNTGLVKPVDPVSGHPPFIIPKRMFGIV